MNRGRGPTNPLPPLGRGGSGTPSEKFSSPAFSIIFVMFLSSVSVNSVQKKSRLKTQFLGAYRNPSNFSDVLQWFFLPQGPPSVLLSCRAPLPNRNRSISSRFCSSTLFFSDDCDRLHPSRGKPGQVPKDSGHQSGPTPGKGCPSDPSIPHLSHSTSLMSSSPLFGQLGLARGQGPRQVVWVGRNDSR